MEPAKSVNIIRHRGEPNKADFHGETITRQESILVIEWMALVPCAHYDDHFIFEVPRINVDKARKLVKFLRMQNTPAAYIATIENEIRNCGPAKLVQMPGPAHVCTCGSSAVVKDHESVNRLFVCHFYETNGYHTTSVINKDDFAKAADEGEILIPKGRKWLI